MSSFEKAVKDSFPKNTTGKKVVSSCSDSNMSHSSDSHGMTCVCGGWGMTPWTSVHIVAPLRLQLVSYEGPSVPLRSLVHELFSWSVAWKSFTVRGWGRALAAGTAAGVNLQCDAVAKSHPWAQLLFSLSVSLQNWNYLISDVFCQCFLCCHVIQPS